MLIRLVGHFKNNPKHIDKLIAIKGLPKEWIFREGTEGKELMRPWTADVDKNIPSDIRQFCEPEYITFRYPPVERGAKEIIEHKKILGVCLDYMTEPGRELWEKIERYVEGTIPRNERIPVPVVCSKDEHSPFETFEPKRSSATNSLVFEPYPAPGENGVPEIDLNSYLPVAPVAAAPVAQIATVSTLACDQCSKVFDKIKALTMHKMKAHPKKEKVEA
jgi:C2H2-type zinc finger protein